MHRFSNPERCRDSDFCLSQIPKRAEGRPRYGQAPDNFTGWGLYFQEGIDLLRLCSWGFFAFVFSLTFGICWALRSKNVQDGFAIASYILAFEALVVGSIQAAIKLNIF